MKFPIHSLRWRLQVWYGLVLLVVVAAFCLAAYQLAWDNQLRQIDKQLMEARHELMVGLLRSLHGEGVIREGKPPPIPPNEIEKRLREGAITLPRDILERFRGNEPGHSYFLIQDLDGRVLLRSENVRSHLSFNLPTASRPASDAQNIGSNRQIVERVGSGMRIVVGRDISPDREDMQRFGFSLAAAGLGTWLLSLIGGWWIAGRAIKPIEMISRTAMRIASGNVEERISTQSSDNELDQLSHILNETFDRLHATLVQQKQFSADASHELRTPVTVLLSETRRILKRERTIKEYQEAIRTCEIAGERMQRLIESLLLLAHQESAAGDISRRNEQCNLAELAATSIEQLRAFGKERGIRIEAKLDPVECRGQPVALSILMNNLIANAIQHQNSPGHVWVETSATAAEAIFEVRDDGPGIPPDELPHVFERFYRVDKARTAESGHTGLGLAIAKTIVENHGGSIIAESEYGKGAHFIVRLPIFYDL